MITLQNIVFPEQTICTEQDLYFHLHGLSSLRGSDNTIHMRTGDQVQFDTYFNALSIGKWHENCTLKGLYLNLRGQGRFELLVWHAIPDRSWEKICSEVIELKPETPFRADLSHYSQNATKGLIFFELRALTRAVFAGGEFQTETKLDTWPKLAVSITTFKREEAVKSTVMRLQNFLQNFEYKENIHIFMVDNGQSVNTDPASNLTYIPNDNLGGAGGFARGLQEAESAGYSHVLFTDDDASFPMESLYRTYTFLALAKDSRTTVAGAMINNTTKWAMWENGAIFDRKCMPLSSGMDLRNRDGVYHLELDSAKLDNPKLYGGWWYFAFPVKHAKYHPYPFFVRGDDVSFSIANDFKINLLNGVLSFQDDFTEKESPLTWYLDLRSHMAHHLSLESMEVGSHQVAKIAIWFFLRNFIKFQYETMETVLLAWEDVMRGPQFFLDNKDMAERRAQIKELVHDELWQPVDANELEEKVSFDPNSNKFRRLLYRFGLNGHLIPFYKFWANRIIVPPQDRGNLNICWGTCEITYLNSDRTKGYTTRLNRLRGLRLLFRAARYYVKFRMMYPSLRKEYRDSYPEIASKDYWQDVYKVTKT
ncbi:MAG: glycosyltransferase [Rhodobacteraceae bacterium]|nr:glycosyltransferase [Paracoccaceae bacterium]